MKVLLATLLLSQVVYGDDALNILGGSEVNSTLIKKEESIKLEDPFVIALYGKMHSSNNLNYDTKRFLNLVFNKDYEKAAHLLTVVEKPHQVIFKIL
jgi:hypothetical protein